MPAPPHPTTERGKARELEVAAREMVEAVGAHYVAKRLHDQLASIQSPEDEAKARRDASLEVVAGCFAVPPGQLKAAVLPQLPIDQRPLLDEVIALLPS